MILLLAVSLTGCKYKEVTRETGYKGKARVNPWLAAERFCERYKGEVRSLASWSPPDYDDAMWITPASVLGNDSFVHEVEDWVDDGGHLVLLVENTGNGNDWSARSAEPALEPAVIRMLDRIGIEFVSEEGREDLRVSKIEFKGQSFEVDARSHGGLILKSSGGNENGHAAGASEKDSRTVFATVRHGDGRVSVLTDGRLFRNRWIGDKEHASLLDALVRGTDYEGDIAIVRGEGISLWALLGDHLWPLMLGLGTLVVLWLWKSFGRFGPVEAATAPSPLRAYDHHLEALGDFQWRLDHAASLLAPLRAQIVERGQRMVASVGRRDEDFFQVLADLAGIPRERAFRALAEAAPPDPATLTRTSADLQRILQVLH